MTLSERDLLMLRFGYQAGWHDAARVGRDAITDVAMSRHFGAYETKMRFDDDGPVGRILRRTAEALTFPAPDVVRGALEEGAL